MEADGEDPAKFLVRVADGIPEMWVDADKVDQVLGNLLENALRHGAGTVTIEVEPAGDGASVTVSDEGEGIPDEQRDRVFTRFWRSGRRGGTGLGLYIVRGLVEAHGGHIEVGRGPGGGAGSDSCCPPRPPTSPTDATRGAAGPQPSATRGPRSSTLRRHLDSGGATARVRPEHPCPHRTSPTTLCR